MKPNQIADTIKATTAIATLSADVGMLLNRCAMAGEVPADLRVQLGDLLGRMADGMVLLMDMMDLPKEQEPVLNPPFKQQEQQKPEDATPPADSNGSTPAIAVATSSDSAPSPSPEKNSSAAPVPAESERGENEIQPSLISSGSEDVVPSAAPVPLETSGRRNNRATRKNQ